MSFSEESKVLAPDWSQHFVEAKKFNGSFATYCRERGIDYDQFMYQRDKIKNKLKSERAMARGLRSGFAKVHVEAPIEGNRYQQLPDAKWLSELIHNLMRVR